MLKEILHSCWGMAQILRCTSSLCHSWYERDSISHERGAMLTLQPSPTSQLSSGMNPIATTGHSAISKLLKIFSLAQPFADANENHPLGLDSSSMLWSQLHSWPILLLDTELPGHLEVHHVAVVLLRLDLPSIFNPLSVCLHHVDMPYQMFASCMAKRHQRGFTWTRSFLSRSSFKKPIFLFLELFCDCLPKMTDAGCQCGPE